MEQIKRKLTQAVKEISYLLGYEEGKP